MKDKIVFITGASSGIGAATAAAFARLGAKLLLCARRLELLNAMDAALREAGAGDVYSIALDVQGRDAVAAALSGLPKAWTEIDVLVNNAGLSRGLNNGKALRSVSGLRARSETEPAERPETGGTDGAADVGSGGGLRHRLA